MSKLRHLLVYSTFIFSYSALASIEVINYYPKSLVNNLETFSHEETLKTELRKVIANYHVSHTGKKDTIFEVCPVNQKCTKQNASLSYKEARRALFGDIDLKTNSRGEYYVEDRYCHKTYTEKHGVGPKRIPQAQFINCEHTWPQSRFNPKYSKSLQKVDLHHLYGVNSRANSTRGNIIFANVIGRAINSECKVSYRGTVDYQNSSTKAFEPPKDHKGNIARALFYFSTRYDLNISQEEEFFLRQWHKEDPVDEEEKLRHEKIYRIQKNRNPYIDDPELVSRVKDF